MPATTMRSFRVLILLMAVAALVAGDARAEGGRVTATYTLPDLPIAQAQNAVLPGSVANDRALLLGGIGSDLWHGANDPPDQFWMVTDRGPNGQIRIDGANRRTFPIPDFTP